MLDGSCGISSSLLQFSNRSHRRRESQLMLGKVTKLFPLKFSLPSEYKKPRPLRFAPSDILQSLKSSSNKEQKFKEEEGTLKETEFELLFDQNHEEDGGPLHPRKDKVLRFLIEKKDGGTTFTTVPSAWSSFNISKFPKFSGNSSNLEQPERMSVSRDLRSQVLLGRLLNILQFSKLKNFSSVKSPSDG